MGNNSSRLAKLKRRGPTFADPLATLRYAAILPEPQRKHRLGILFTSNKGQRCSLILVEYNGERRLYLNPRGLP